IQAQITCAVRDLNSLDERVRAKAVRKLCPCRTHLHWTLDRYVVPMLHDPSPIVRFAANFVLSEELENEMVREEQARHSSPSDQLDVVVTVRYVASVQEMVQLEQAIAAQFPQRHSASARAAEPETRFEKNPSLTLLAEQHGRIVGGARAFRTGDAVQVDVLALEPAARRLGIGRNLMEAIESEAIRLEAGRS